MAFYYWPWPSIALIDPQISTAHSATSKPHSPKQQAPPSDCVPFASQESYYKALVCAALACLLRPTNVIVWAFLGGILLWYNWKMGTGPRLLVGAVAVG